MSTISARITRPRGEFRAAAQECWVIWAGMFTLGIGFGVLVTSTGLPWWLAPIISGAMFAGSVEFILVGMLAVTAPIAGVALTTLLINSRHLFYGLSFPLHRVTGRFRRAYSVFALCDEAFAVLSTKDPATLTSSRMLWTQVGMHASWVAGSLLGAVAGASVLHGIQGLEFVLTALFIVLTMDAFRASPQVGTLVVAAGVAAVAALLTPGSMVLVAMTAFTGVMAVRHHLITRRMRHCNRGMQGADHA